MRIKLFLLFVAVALSAHCSVAQDISYGIVPDSVNMLIGDQQYIRLQVKSDVPLSVEFPKLDGQLSREVEILSGPKRDSLKGRDGKWLIEETYLVTAFDTGLYVIPALPITIKDASFDQVLMSKEVAFYVNSFVIEDESNFFDIVMPHGAPLSFAEILPYLLWGLGGLLFVALVVWVILKLRKKANTEEAAGEWISPYERAMEHLKRLKEEKLWQAGRIKEYYTGLTDAVRQYIGDELGIPAMEQTSLETIRDLKKCKEIDKEDQRLLAEMLHTSDFVKFAKLSPLPDENTKNMEVAYNFLERTHRRLEELKNETGEEKGQL